MTRNIDTALLRAFVSVAETGGMTSAGRLLNLTQAAVSQQVKRLEEVFGEALFVRGRGQLGLTPAGERLMPHAERMVAMNDEVFGLMTSPEFEGEVRVGVPHDIVRPFMPPILKSFDQAWSRVRVVVICRTTPYLLQAMEQGEVDLTLTTERADNGGGECLLSDNLVWVGARHGRAHTRDPLPVSLADCTCAFRQASTKALSASGRDWRMVCEDSNMMAVYAALEADLAIAPMLLSSVPEHLQVLEPTARLPSLPTFHINLYLPVASAGDIAHELARHIRRQFAARYEQVA